MATSRANLKWDRQTSWKDASATKGVKPLPDPMTLQQMMVDLLMHVCRLILLRQTLWRIAFYSCIIFCGSLVAIAPIPRTYFSQKTNILNVYFVKLGWAWTLVVTGSFVCLTSAVYCCGERAKIGGHLGRLGLATILWKTCISLFDLVESATSHCVMPGDHAVVSSTITHDACLARGYRWQGFDISGHIFILVYSSLIMFEEAKCIRGWTCIADLIRNREYDDDSPLRGLSAVQLARLQSNYVLLGKYVKSVFVAMTALSLLWDFMLLCTVAYFHTPPQKVAGGLFAIGAWFASYRLVFPSVALVGLPGQGLFKYQAEETALAPSKAKPQYARKSLAEMRLQRPRQANGAIDMQPN